MMAAENTSRKRNEIHDAGEANNITKKSQNNHSLTGKHMGHR